MFRTGILFVSLFMMIGLSILSAENKSLSLKESTPLSGAVDVSPDQPIELVFSNNVVNISVQEVNKTCFLLTDNNGITIPLEIAFPDDQMEPELKRTIILKPHQPLEKSKTYTLKIDGKLESKNGQVLGEDIIVEFSTGK